MTVCIVISCVGFVVCCASVYMLIRNDWVCKMRLRVLHEDAAMAKEKIKSGQYRDGESFHPRFEALPSYESMLYRFWIWDMNKFLAVQLHGGIDRSKS